MASTGYQRFSQQEVDAIRADILERQGKPGYRAYRVAKRIFDILFSGLALLILWPFFLILALVIYVDDPHASPFFLQKRVGKDGKTFTMHKFRTMYKDAEDRLDELMKHNEMSGPAFKMKNDPRILPVGRVLRRTSIDELPQLIDVLLGKMSLVGPRPPLPREVKQYGSYERLRFLIKPGLTCIWQTQAKRNSIPFQQWIGFDIEYIQTQNLCLDLKLILKTVGVMVNGEGE